VIRSLLPTLIAALAAGCVRPSPEPEAAAAAFAASQPEYLRPFPYTPVPAGLPDLRPETCGACHREIYEEWRVSTHARAWEDPQFQAELRKQVAADSLGRPTDASWTCVNCHIPLENQHERQVVGLEDDLLNRPVYAPNRRFAPELVDQAIGCATCHVRDGVIHGPDADVKAPHPTVQDPALRTTSPCVRCHQAEASFPQIDLACMFRTGTELSEGPYAAEGYVCQSCHMPAVDRPVATGGPVRHGRRHWFGGSLIPKSPDREAELAPLRDQFPDGLTVDLAGAARDPDGALAARFVATNAHAGHRLPTGDPERSIEVVLRALDAQGRVLAERRERIGSRYQWYPEIRLLSDNRLAPRESRDWPLRVPRQDGPVRLEVLAAKYRLSAESLAFHHLEGRYVAGRTFLRRAWTVPPGGAPAPADPPPDDPGVAFAKPPR
jgi:hypothetical protein